MEQQEFDLAKYLKSVWRFKLIIILLILVAGGTSFGFTATRPTIYEAKATVMVESGQPTLALPAGVEITYLQDIDSQIEVMKSNSVLERAITQLEPEIKANQQDLELKRGKLRNNLKVQQVRGTSLVAVTVVSTSPVEAQKKANAIAEAYVYEARRTRLTAIDTALENTTKQLKELRVGKVDISVSPSLTWLTAQIDTALVALEAASEGLQQIRLRDAVATQEESPRMARDPGTSLTPSQLSTISQQMDAATSKSNELTELAQHLKLEPIDVAAVESQTRALATNLEALATQLGAVREAEIDAQVYRELLAVEEQVRVATATCEAALEQVLELAGDLYNRIAPNEYPWVVSQDVIERHRNLRYRIIEHTALVATTLKSASEQLKQIEPREAAVTQRQIDMLDERVASATATLQSISQQLHPPSPEQGILLAPAELAAMQTRARTVTTNLNFLLSEVEEIPLNELNFQAYSEFLSFKEWIVVAIDKATELPDEIADLAEGGGGSLSYAALENLRQELQLALLTSGSSGIRVVDTAMISSSTTGIFGRFNNVIISAVLALILGILLALVLQYFDRTVRDASQVASYVRLPILAQVASTPAIGYPRPPSILNGTASQYLEAFRMLRTNLGLDSYQGQVLLISSPEEKEGKTTIAANLARVVALQGRKVLLIDGNLRKPGIATAFGQAEGLPEFLTGEKEPWDYITQAEDVDILASTEASARSAEMLSSPQMKALMEKARQTYDVVIVDSAPVIGYADTRILAREVDTALLILQPDVSKLDLAKDSRQALETMGARVVGFALNKVETKKRKFFRNL